MGGKSLRNEDTEIGRRIWKAIDEAAAKVPRWLQEELRLADATTIIPSGSEQDDEAPGDDPESGA